MKTFFEKKVFKLSKKLYFRANLISNPKAKPLYFTALRTKSFEGDS